jgi:DNA-binding winged helix-turn-helix (wHTH) protein/tetratricopeptide (TPR) repeat protein
VEFRFGCFQLDTANYSLRHGSEDVDVEPKVFDLLALFARHPGEVITREQMLAEVWGGRLVSDAALSTAVKAARRALGDDGDRQVYIETVRGRGFRFRPDQSEMARPASGPLGAGPSVAVLPFAAIGDLDRYRGLEEAIPHDVLIALSRLRWLTVIARNSSFQLPYDADVGDAGRTLGVTYIVSGTVEVFGPSLSVGVSVSDCRDRSIVWADRLSGRLEDVWELRERIVAAVTSSIETDVPLHEAREAMLRPQADLDAWQLFHLGLRSVHQYTADGNAAARDFFTRAVARDPGFARAHAGLSFTSFQDAFMGYVADRQTAIAEARQHAESGLELDPLEPFANFTLGRSLWLQKDLGGAVSWIDRAIALNPNYAQGIYTRALIETLSGSATSGGDGADIAMRLSPLDPLLYAMRAVKALSAMERGDYAEAARWGDAAARTPRAHVIILLVAAVAHLLNGDRASANALAAGARVQRPDVTAALFFESLPFVDGELRQRIAYQLAQLELGAPAATM